MAAKVRCPQCGKMVKQKFRYCDQCGTDLWVYAAEPPRKERSVAIPVILAVVITLVSAVAVFAVLVFKDNGVDHVRPLPLHRVMSLSSLLMPLTMPPTSAPVSR